MGFCEQAGVPGEQLVITGIRGGALVPAVWQKAWTDARRNTGLDHLHLHDLRHSGNTLAAATGASTKELMARMGHASPAAALRYQHATADRDRVIAQALSDLAASTAVVPIEAVQQGSGGVAGSRLGHAADRAARKRARKTLK